MGIQGLLPLLKSIQKPTHLRNFAGQTLGVDAYGWLHRGTVSCAIELAEQKPTKKHIDFCMSRVRMLIHFGVKPYLVFDGDYLPSKEHTEKERAARRKESKRAGLELLRMGRPSQAYLELQKAVDVTPSMARELIEELKVLNVPYVVAPYEADSQLAYLEKRGLISGVLSEDSDLLVFGVKCLLTKLDQYGECVMVNRADFTACRDISLVGWSDKEFRMMAMLSGCDYLLGIDKMGLKTAYRLVRKHNSLDRLIRSVQFDGKMKVPPKYLDAFAQAENTFLHQWVFCAEAKCLVNLNPIPADVDVGSMPYIGKQVEPELAMGVAVGDLDPNTKLPLTFNRRQPNITAQQRFMQTPDEKQGKSITEFFKAKRTPLAELDPNSFTPSPSQQRLLANQRGVSWSATQAAVARPPALGRVAEVNRRMSAPQTTTRSLSGQATSQRTSSPKRQRLCSDNVSTNSTPGAASLSSAQSRFFTKQGVQPSPSLRKASSRKDDFELWSDDSAVEALLNAEPTVVSTAKDLPTPKKRKKIQVYEDGDAPSATAISKHDHASQSTIASTLTNSHRSVLHTPATSFGTQGSETSTNVFTNGVNSNFAALKSPFSFKATGSKSSIPRMRSMPTANIYQRTESVQAPGRPKTTATTPERVESETHDAQETGCKDEDDTLDAVPESSPVTASRHIANDPTDMISDGEWLATELQEVSANASHGSEDLLVPESPESIEDGARMRPRLDFGRFAFAG
ncbi:Rad2 nuclease [Extremus antarcticus]|uniref:Rad2 nuclease n=1 Tax=Extremus antarcticus TaxID=702011 RepID=A0AAJ0DG02_9PEZI|nr:Rad2 nuclease [Extremus antarcticus]